MMNNIERHLLEAIQSMFHNDPEVLGITQAGRPNFPKQETSNFFQKQYEQLREEFALKINSAGLNHYDGLCAAFFDIHNYTYITDIKFPINFEQRCRSMAIPHTEIDKAKEIIEELSKKTKAEFGDERSSGWANIEDMRDVTTHADTRTPKREAPFTGGGPNPKQNELSGSLV